MNLICYYSNKKLKNLKSVWLILLIEFCVRFSYYGFRTVLVLYLTRILHFNEDTMTILHHSCVFLFYSMSLIGAILADTYWGKFKTIIRLSAAYIIGSMILTGASMAKMFNLNVQKALALLGLFVVSVGAGGIRSCIFPFGSDQFQLPKQTKQFQRFITKFMVVVSVGALVTSFVTPELLENVLHRFGKNTFYPLAFGVPATLMLIATVILGSGKNVCTNMKPDQNAIARTIGCMIHALRTKFSITRFPRDNHWLDYAEDEYTETEISETKTTLNVITVFTAYPMYWALSGQQSTRWTLQATLMDGRLDFFDWTVKPDQIQMITPFFGLLFLFLFDLTLYPLLAKVGVQKPLQKITFSSCLAVIAFILAALLQFKINGDDPFIPPEEGRLNIYNGFDCNVILHSPSLNVENLGPLEMISVNYTGISRKEIVEIELRFDPKCTLVPENFTLNTNMTVAEEKEISYYLTRSNLSTIELTRIGIYDNLMKNRYGNPILRVLIDYTLEFEDNISLTSADKTVYRFPSFRGMDFVPMKVGKYSLCWNGIVFPTSVELSSATSYTLILQRNGYKMDAKLFAKYESNRVHLFWQLPQYFCMIVADIIFLFSCLEYSMIEAPVNLKSVISAFDLLTAVIGNLLVVIISNLSIGNQAYEYLIYSGLMGADTMLFAYFSVVYRSGNKTLLEKNLKPIRG